MTLSFPAMIGLFLGSFLTGWGIGRTIKAIRQFFDTL